MELGEGRQGGEGKNNLSSRSYNPRANRSRSGSESDSWRKSSQSESKLLKGTVASVGEEVTSPLKNLGKESKEKQDVGDGKAKKIFLFEVREKLNASVVEKVGNSTLVPTKSESVDAMNVETVQGHTLVVEKEKMDKGKVEKGSEREEGKGVIFKRKSRASGQRGQVPLAVHVGRKREGELMDVDAKEEEALKRARLIEGQTNEAEAGLSEQPCNKQ